MQHTEPAGDRGVESTTDIMKDETGKQGEIGTEIDILASTSQAKIVGKDPTTGQFLPGHRLGAQGRRGRSRKGKVLELIESTVPVAEVVQAIYALITNESSWRAREAGVKLYLSYMVGMPVQRSVTATTKLESILNRLGEMDEEEFKVVEQELWTE